jgi:hypothetical protein
MKNRRYAYFFILHFSFLTWDIAKNARCPLKGLVLKYPLR